MLHPTDDLRIAGIKPLIPPAILMEELPISEPASATVSRCREEIRAALEGRDDRLVVVAGPCSIHEPESAHEYADRLIEAAGPFAGDLMTHCGRTDCTRCDDAVLGGPILDPSEPLTK